MENVKTEIKGKQLTITIDLSKRLGPSKSGKTTMIASTGGSANLGDGMMLGLNLYIKNATEKKGE